MKVIKGEIFQNLADIAISKVEHLPFESQDFKGTWYDIDTYDFTDFDNPFLVYCNNSLINQTKPSIITSDLYGKLKQFKNKFILILHNADQDFTENHIKFLDLPNCDHIFAQSITIDHPKLTLLPMGLPNKHWHYSNEESILEVSRRETVKAKTLYFNFSMEGEHRYSQRKNCYETLLKNGFEQNQTQPVDRYFEELSEYWFCACPPGNTIDTYRMYECLYLKVIPICERNETTELIASHFPVLLVDDWNEVTIDRLTTFIEKNEADVWQNYLDLDFDNLVDKLGIKDV